MILMAVAARTTQITLGTFVLVAPLYNPAHLSEAAAAVDSLSRGRLILGLGSGYHKGYFDHFGLPFSDRGARLEESLGFLRQAWRGERFDWHSDTWQMDGVLVTPRPFREEGPPIWLAGTTEKPLKRAGAMADGVALHSVHISLAKLGEWVDIYRDAAVCAGRQPVVAIVIAGYIGIDDDEARATYQPLVDADQRAAFYISKGMLDGNSVAKLTIDSDTLVVGGSHQAAAKVLMIQKELALGANDWFLFHARTMWGPSRQQTVDSIGRFGRDVVPLVNATC
jgi:alkanesulfonate monooxygenase SsuD/methylene tetrahydromethanopterin reductase-like flavin-dependent oxidoreductase (luciferase family)